MSQPRPSKQVHLCASKPESLATLLEVAALFRKYVQSTVRTLDLDTDAQKEYNRQRNYLEKSALPAQLDVVGSSEGIEGRFRYLWVF